MELELDVDEEGAEASDPVVVDDDTSTAPAEPASASRRQMTKERRIWCVLRWQRRRGGGGKGRTLGFQVPAVSSVIMHAGSIAYRTYILYLAGTYDTWRAERRAGRAHAPSIACF